MLKSDLAVIIAGFKSVSPVINTTESHSFFIKISKSFDYIATSVSFSVKFINFISTLLSLRNLSSLLNLP